MSRRTLPPIATALTLVAAGIAATAWLTSAQESTRVTTATTANATTNANANSDANASQPVAASPSPQAQKAPGAATAATAATTQQPSAPSTAGQRAFIDPATGQFRQPEHEELAAIAAEAAAGGLARRTAAARTATASEAMFGPDGSVSATVPEELHTFTVARRGPDGRIVIEHAQGKANATRMVKANSAKNTPQASVSRAQQEEDRNDR